MEQRRRRVLDEAAGEVASKRVTRVARPITK